MEPTPHLLVLRLRDAVIALFLVAGVVAATTAFAPGQATAAPAATQALAADATGTPPADEPSATPKLPLPLRMADVGDARQLLVATAPKLGDTMGLLQVFDLVDGVWTRKFMVSARFGKRGLIDGLQRKAGSLTTPTGIWAMPNFIFGTHASAPSGSKMRFRHLTRSTWWSSRRGSTYNTWVRARTWTGEHIGTSPKAYEFAVSMGYNASPNPSVYGRGTGIFLHVRGTGLTAGCVAISRRNMIRVCRFLNRGKRPRFAVGTTQPGTPTSIWAY